MKIKEFNLTALICLIFLISACSEPSRVSSTDPMATSVAQISTSITSEDQSGCVNEIDISYLCGPRNAEDILRIADSQWLLVSGMNGELSGNNLNGQIHLVNHQDKTYDIIFPGENPQLEQDMERFAGCPGPLDVTNFSSHGLALRSGEGRDQYLLYMTSHGAREAIEVFEVDTFLRPTLKWIGCVPMPETSWTNSIALLSDGGFLATQFMDPTGSGMAGVTAGEITGHLFEWHPGEAVSVIDGTELSGPNGIVISDDQRWIYVAAFGTAEVVRFDRITTPVSKESVKISIAPDNIRWSSDRTLYTAGGNVTEDCSGPNCGTGWSVIEIIPYSLRANRLTGVDETAAMQGVSSALLVDDEIWIGTYSGDRLGILPKP